MTGLRKPPARDRPSRLLLRMTVLIILLAVAGVAIWTAVTIQRIDLVESVSLESVDRGETVDAAGVTVNVVEGEGSGTPVVLLHDFDIAGGLLWEEVATRLGDGFHPVRLDLPGFGFSQRLTEPGEGHTVAAMAEIVAEVVQVRYGTPVVLAGVGLGGEVGAELAVTRPDLIRGLVMVDADFERAGDWVSFAEKLPYMGLAVIHTFEAGGRFAVDRWAPRCDEGGWCPNQEQIAYRDQAARVAGTTASLRAFFDTPRSSLVPSELDTISVPSVFVWSTDGEVTEEAMTRVVDQVPGVSLMEVDAWKAHIEAPDSVIEAIELVGR